MKKFISCLLAAAMILSLLPVFCAAATTVAAKVTASNVNNTVEITVTLPPVSHMEHCFVSVEFDPAVVTIPNNYDGYFATYVPTDGTEAVPYFYAGLLQGGYQKETNNIVKSVFLATDSVTKTSATPFAKFVFTVLDKTAKTTSFKVNLEQFKDDSATVEKGEGYSIGTVTVPINIALPAAPTVKAASASYNSVKVSWNAVSGATAYDVYYSIYKSGPFIPLGTTTLTSYTHSGRTMGATYYYKVMAQKTVSNTKCYGAYSEVVSAKPVLSTPSAKIAAYSYNSIKVSWNAVSGATGYIIYYATSQSGTYSKIATTTSTSYTHTGRSIGKTYYYKVIAYRTVNSKNYYSSYSSIISAKAIPSTPSAKAASASYNSVKVSWNAVSGASRYVVYYATSKTGTYSTLATTTATSYTHTKRTTGKTYYYKVRVYRTVSGTNYYSNYSAIVSAKPVPSVPGSFTVAKASSTSIKTSWKAVSGASGYQVYRATSSTGTYSLVKTTTSLSYTNTGLTKGKTYYYKVRAYRTVSGTKYYGSFTSAKYIKLS